MPILPSLSLAKALTGYKANNPENAAAYSSLPRNNQLQHILDDAKKDIPLNSRPPSSVDKEHVTIMLTGSTGSLGSYILDTLINHPAITKIYCLNRSEDSQEKQKAVYRIRGLSTDFKKAIFLQSNIAKTRLGLEIQTYLTVLKEVNCIIHNAWTVDFNRSIQYFHDTHIKDVQHLIDFASQSRNQARLFFLSSISTVQSWEAEKQENQQTAATKVSEQIFENWNVPQCMGYAEAKHICELLLKEASLLHVSTSICRVGQIFGPVPQTNGNVAQAGMAALLAFLFVLPRQVTTRSRASQLHRLASSGYIK